MKQKATIKDICTAKSKKDCKHYWGCLRHIQMGNHSYPFPCRERNKSIQRTMKQVWVKRR